jgi:glycosyltransferase involved in cell wall biosynthesis
MAQACVKENAPIDLTVYFLGTRSDEILSPHVRFRFLPPVFSTARLKFLPYVPAHTDLASFHSRLAQELPGYDLFHATDGFFAFARTAERVSGARGIPLVTSFHTDIPAYAELFTHDMLQNLFGKKVGTWVDYIFKISKLERYAKESRLGEHLRACAIVLAMRPTDKELAQKFVSGKIIKPMRMGVDKEIFTPQQDARAEVERDYKIAPGKFLTLFVGRVDAGKNVPLLLRACVKAIEKGAKLHLIAVGLGPLSAEVKAVLRNNVTLTGFLPPEKLAKIYAGVDCLSMASDIEIGGLVGVEALSCGCPVLASKASGVASLYGNPAALKEVDGTISSWADSLVSFAKDKTQQAAMREAALAFRREKLAGWGEILKEDFLPIWQSLVRKEKE